MGQDKAQLNFLGESLLNRMIRIVQSECRLVVAAAGPNQSLTNASTNVVISRDEAPHQGPIHGLRAALRLVPAHYQHAFVVGCDTPLLRSEVIRLLQARAKMGKAVVVDAQGFRQPLPAVYPIRESLAQVTAKSLMDLLRSLEVEVVPESEIRPIDPSLDSFQPMNTLDEWQAAIRRANS
jgi:molybdopterin-guanine dinucleotide biosynthesis protein A